MPTTVVHCNHEPYDVYIGRGSRWGNPFRIGLDGNRDEVIDKYADWLMTQSILLAKVGQLKDKRLGCYCAPKRCHGNILAQLADTVAALPSYTWVCCSCGVTYNATPDDATTLPKYKCRMCKKSMCHNCKVRLCQPCLDMINAL